MQPTQKKPLTAFTVISTIILLLLTQTLIKMKPTAAKGTYMKSIYLSSTMSPSVAVDTKTV